MDYDAALNVFDHDKWNGLEKVPCASMLMRVDYASVDDRNNIVSVYGPGDRRFSYIDPPRDLSGYRDGKYRPTLFNPSPVEREMLKNISACISDEPLQDVVEAVIEYLDGVQRTPTKLRPLLESFAKKMPTFNPYEIGPLDLTFLAPYNPKLGFRYNLTELRVSPLAPGLVFTASAVLCPPLPVKNPIV